MFWGGEGVDIYIRALKEWGELLDKFLENRENYLLFDYLVNSLYKDNKYNEYHFMKDYSLCQLFLEDRHEKELIRCGIRSMHWILTHFMNHIGKNIRSSSISEMLRS